MTDALIQYTVVRIAKEGNLPASAISAEAVGYLLRTNPPEDVVRIVLGKPKSNLCVHQRAVCGICAEARQ